MKTPMKQGERSGREVPLRLTQNLRTLVNFSRAAMQAANEHQLLQSVCEILIKDGGFQAASVEYLEANSQEALRNVAQAGDHAAELRNLKLTQKQADKVDLANVAIRTGEPCCRKDLHLISLPLKSDGQKLGVLTLYTNDSAQFEQDTV